ncbi:MAG: DUF1854 domain-containing protein [Planctomycetota bacterium]
MIDTQIHFLAGVTLRRDAFGRISLEAGGVRHEDVRPVAAFPLSAPERHVAVLGAEGTEIGIIRDPAALDGESRRILEEEMDLRNFTARITAIRAVRTRFGMSTWEVETDRGTRTAYLRERMDLHAFPGGRVILSDTSGIRYEIPDLAALDERSRDLLGAEM